MGRTQIGDKDCAHVNLYAGEDKPYTLQLFIDDTALEIVRIVMKGREGSDVTYTVTSFSTSLEVKPGCSPSLSTSTLVSTSSTTGFDRKLNRVNPGAPCAPWPRPRNGGPIRLVGLWKQVPVFHGHRNDVLDFWIDEQPGLKWRQFWHGVQGAPIELANRRNSHVSLNQAPCSWRWFHTRSPIMEVTNQAASGAASPLRQHGVVGQGGVLVRIRAGHVPELLQRVEAGGILPWDGG